MGASVLSERGGVAEKPVAGRVTVPDREDRVLDWRSTIGMFEGDPVIREIQEEGRKIREAERRDAQRDSKP